MTSDPARARAGRVLALHGFTGTGHDFAPVADDDWITPDVIGHGAAPAPHAVEPYAMAAEVERLRPLIDRHRGDPGALLIGYSMGGRLALALALDAIGRRRDAIRGLVLIGATAGVEDPAQREARRAQDAALADRIEAIGIPAFTDEWSRKPIIASQARIAADARAAMRARRLAQRPWGLANSLRGMGAGAMPSLWHRLHAITCPVLLVTGAEDAKFAAIADGLARRLPSADRAVMPDAGHCAHLEQPARFARRLAAWRAQTGV